jgi:hypothetical protein
VHQEFVEELQDSLNWVQELREGEGTRPGRLRIRKKTRLRFQ